MRRFFSSAIVADSRAAFLPRPLSCARLQTLWSAEPQHDLFHKAILVPNAYRSFCPSSNVHEFRGRQRRLSSIDGSGIHRARQCGSVQTASDRDMTASTQCRPNPSNPAVKKVADFISIGLSRQLVPGTLDARCAEYSRPYASRCVFAHAHLCRMYQLDVERSMPIV